MFDKNSALKLQTSLKNNGFDVGIVDGLWGSKSQAALEASKSKYDIAWSIIPSKEFVEKTKTICGNLNNSDPSYLMSCMAFETGRTFSPTIRNSAGAPYWGIIQGGAMFFTDVGITQSFWVSLTAEQQLDYVYKWYKPYVNKLIDLPSFYFKILWPAAMDKPDTYVLWDKADSKRAVAYTQNRGLDINSDGQITRGEVSRVIWNMYAEGMLIKNRRALS